MATTNNYENMTQCKTCRCGEADTNIWTTKNSDNPDKQIQKCSNCQVLKSGTLFLSSKGIGWTSWKKRWFILTRTSLVFYRSDPNATPQKGNDANLTLGGIDLNNSGSVVVKADKKLLTVLFPDGRDGRTFTLKAETSEDLHEWRTALENALAQAPSPALAMGQNGILRNDVADPVEASVEQWKDRRPVKSLVVGRPILLALEDIDGTPSFLEKALRFIEDHGIKVEGILRQSADVEEVERRVHEYEQGKVEFSSDEDAHVVGDCIKHILRELPSSPVPATSCTALVEAYRTDRGSRISSMRAAITDTFPEPNRRLVQRILKMMRTIASNKSVNRMTLSAVAACMAPLLLRPLLAGDCDLEDDFNMGGDGSLQLLQAAAAANHAQAIVIILLEEYERIFDEDILEEASIASDLYSESEDGGVEDEHSTDNGSLDDDGFSDPDNELVDDSECSSSRTLSESNSDACDDYHEKKAFDEQSSVLSSPLNMTPVVQETSTDASFLRHVALHKDDISQRENSNSECANISNDPLPNIKQPTVWGRTAARKNLSMEAIDFSGEDEIAIQKLEMTMDDLQTKIANEVKGNEILHASLGRRKEVLHKRRLALEQDVERLQEQLHKEIDMGVCLEAGLKNLELGQFPIPSSMDNKTRENLEEISLAEADINNLKQQATELHGQLSHQKQHNYAFLCETCSQQLYMMYQSEGMKQQKDVDGTTIVHKKEQSTKQEDPLSGLAIENLQAQSQDSPSSLNREPSRNQQLTSQAQSNTVCPGFDDSQNTVLSTATIDPPEKNSANNKNAPLRAVDEDVSKQIVDSHSSPKNQFHDAAPKKSSSRKENSMLGAELENVKSQTEDSPSPPDKLLTQKLQPNRTNQRSTKCEESINVLSMGLTMSGNDTFTKTTSPTSVTVKKKHSFNKGKIAAGTSSAYGDEITPTNSMHGAACDYSKTQSQESPSSPDSHSPQKSKSKTTKQSSKSTEEPTMTVPDTASNKFSFSNETFEIEQSFQNSMASRGSSSVSVEEPKTVGHGGALKKSTSKGETQPQDFLSAHKLQRNAVNQSGNRSTGLSFTPSAEEPVLLGRSTASKKSSFRGETVKMESQDSPSFTNRQQPCQKLTHPNSMKSLGPGSDELTISRNAAYRRSSTRGEETGSSTSSALAKLTNRLNFLKERRVQLVNELQNLDAGRTIGSEGLPPRNDSR